ncbi:hypothetical protein CORC01_02074 [Colletotrichum orchidophilum]|uniref:Uncharacterized protein n=1 Tax=Colletotrichum orchidophilum TaxID=1209926 RepID=A0A1G4BMZ4_9PEZI|nr:uncharacterized protein CORC01_02074 [Colletotrichum orchidophilum]OHF02678.1 hypothetical protein CORC01_02074 [Colletotrichum orchidophilum]
MYTQSTLTLLAAAAALHLATPVSANYETGKAVQVNFYSNAGCSSYTSETAAWWTRSPRAGEWVNGGSAGECFSLGMPGASGSLNVANVWRGNGAQTGGGCDLYDGYNCGGVHGYIGFSSGSGSCAASRSSNGLLWKSAKCGAV